MFGKDLLRAIPNGGMPFSERVSASRRKSGQLHAETFNARYMPCWRGFNGAGDLEGKRSSAEQFSEPPLREPVILIGIRVHLLSVDVRPGEFEYQVRRIDDTGAVRVLRQREGDGGSEGGRIV